MLPFIHLGPLTFALYGLFVALGAVAAYQLSVANARRLHSPASAGQMLASLFIIVAWGGLCSKLYMVVCYPEQFLRHPADFLSQNGFVFYGAAIGVVAIFPLLARLNRVSTLCLMDLAAPGIALAYGIGRLGCFFSGDGDYGIPTGLPWGMTFPQGLEPTTVPVHPTPLYEFAGAALIAAYLWRRGARGGPAGSVAAQYLIWTALARFSVEFIKRNPVVALGLGNAQWVALISAAAGIGLWWVLRARKAAAPPAFTLDRAVENGGVAEAAARP
jgi:phosphatidylglycerol---prolipoprotein diacylglyceryl transferase